MVFKETGSKMQAFCFSFVTIGSRTTSDRNNLFIVKIWWTVRHNWSLVNHSLPFFFERPKKAFDASSLILDTVACCLFLFRVSSITFLSGEIVFPLLYHYENLATSRLDKGQISHLISSHLHKSGGQHLCSMRPDGNRVAYRCFLHKAKALSAASHYPLLLL